VTDGSSDCDALDANLPTVSLKSASLSSSLLVLSVSLYQSMPLL